MLNDEADIVMFSALARVKAEYKAYDRAAEEFSADIRARMEDERSERERTRSPGLPPRRARGLISRLR